MCAPYVHLRDHTFPSLALTPQPTPPPHQYSTYNPPEMGRWSVPPPYFCFWPSSQLRPPDTRAPAMSTPMAGCHRMGQRGYQASRRALLLPMLVCATPAASHARMRRTRKKSAMNTWEGEGQVRVSQGCQQVPREETSASTAARRMGPTPGAHSGHGEVDCQVDGQHLSVHQNQGPLNRTYRRAPYPTPPSHR